MQKGSNDGAHDRCRQVQPPIVENAGRHYRAKRPRRVEGWTREGSAHEDVEGQRHSDRERCEVAGAARNRRAEHQRSIFDEVRSNAYSQLQREDERNHIREAFGDDGRLPKKIGLVSGVF